MLYMNQLDDAQNEEILLPGTWSTRGLSRLARHHAAEKADVIKAHSGFWRPGAWISAEAQNAVAKEYRENPFAGKRRQLHHSFEFAAEEVIIPATTRFGKWHNEECLELKDLLVSLDTRGNGRVRFPDFYGQSQGKWYLAEPLEYLRPLGVLDETSTSRGPQVLIPNYVLSLSNCVEPSAYYSVCCLSECEELLATLEQQVGGPVASAEQITKVIRNIETSSMDGPLGNFSLQLQ